jgi:hypothetical protein
MSKLKQLSYRLLHIYNTYYSYKRIKKKNVENVITQISWGQKKFELPNIFFYLKHKDFIL